MARLNPESPGTDEIHAVLTTPDLVHAAKAVWMFLRITPDPQSQKAIADALHMDPASVARLLRGLASKGLARRVHGVWLPEAPR
ncbi:helix-turn-helix domain-containing protein [Streptomyces mirabilis]|uniref:helix-turn-helix domain-containing protein n=1 Tax=Streptomyces mirabilis TaxID=68239 RepID=UPI0036C73B6C